ncbi:MAG TPA: hypothetical protein EYP59_03900 [Thiotrichaceae bacterium]|nr:hypothetical protein [Thiotrichaceae bacterium]
MNAIKKWWQVIIDNFNNDVDSEVWFVKALKQGIIDYWNFNAFLWSKPGDPMILAIREKDFEIWQKIMGEGWEIVNSRSGIALIIKKIDISHQHIEG